MPTFLIDLMTAWSSAKNDLETVLPFDNSLLHVVVGYVVYRLISVVEQRPSSPMAWWITLGAAVSNEAIDLLVERWPNLMDQLFEGLSDIGWTIALPTVAIAISGHQFLTASHGKSRLCQAPSNEAANQP